MNTDPAALARTAAELAINITDPAQRACAITGILKASEDADLIAIRKADVRKLRETLTLREISEFTGLSIARIDQLTTGRVTGRRAKPRDGKGTPS